MGRGIAAAIPLTIKPHDRFGIEKRDFSTGFFDNFDISETDGGKAYTIKPDLLLKNYKSFLLEFYELIEEGFEETTRLVPGGIPDASTLDEFIEAFDGGIRNNREPFIYYTHAFSFLGGVSDFYWLFYSGSYKADLEVYSTLLHFERILAKAMKNPLAGAVKFGIFG